MEERRVLHELFARVRGSRALRLKRGRRGPTHRAVALALLAWLAPDDASAAVSPEFGRLLDSGLAYLATAEEGVGVDVAVLLEIVSELTGSDGARRVAELRRIRMAPEKVAPFEALFGLAKPVVEVGAGDPDPEPRASRHGTEPAPGRPRMSDCLVAAARCAIAPECEAVALDRGATRRGLTHQAVWLLFVRWSDCPTDVDLDALGSDLVLRLRAEIAQDSAYSETSLERLAVLGQLGHADEISPLWWPTIVGAQGGDGCWGAEAGGRCHPHPTILALWALAHLDAARIAPAK